MVEKAQDEWWMSFYDDIFAQIVLDRETGESLERITKFLIEKLKLKPNDVIFDQCCGTGSVSNALESQGFKAIGVDIIDGYIEKAQKFAAEKQLNTEFYADDAFTFKPNQSCDAAINWYTSFGYFDDDKKNIEMLKRVYETLKNGGLFALDYSNTLVQVRRAEEPYTEHYETTLTNGETVNVERIIYFDLERGMRGSHWNYKTSGGYESTKSGESRMYMPSELKDMLTEVGFNEIEFYGDINGSPLTLDSPRCIAIARK